MSRIGNNPIDIPSGQLATAQAKDFLYEVKMLMRPGGHKVAIGVHDDVAAVASFLTGEVTVYPR